MPSGSPVSSTLSIQGNWVGGLSATEAETLISKAKIGDREAFAALYREYVPIVHRYVARRVPGAQRAEDLVAETFVKALRNMSRYEFRGVEFSAWLLRIARNLILDHAKRSSTTLEVSTDIMPEGDHVPDPSVGAFAALDARSLQGAMQKLNDEHRQVLELRFVKGLPAAQVSEAMGKSEGAVRVLQYRALKALKREIERSAPELIDVG